MKRIYLPSENVYTSCMSLDDARLIEMIEYCKEILDNADLIDDEVEFELRDDLTFNHYKSRPDVIAHIGYFACREYEYRFNEKHEHSNFFYEVANDYLVTVYSPHFEQYYPNRPQDTRKIKYDNNDLYKDMLNEEWYKDFIHGIPNTWTKRQKPEWYNIKEFGYERD